MSAGTMRVSGRGQMNLPSTARRRWNLVDGGAVTCFDLGDVVIIAPKDLTTLRRELLDAIDDSIWEAAASGFGDPDLADE